MTTAEARLLLICDTYPPVMGGSEIEAQRISAALIQKGHSVQVLCAGGPLMPAVRDWIDPEGVPVRILTRRSQGRWKDLSFAIQVAWHIWSQRDRYDVVYFLMQGLHLAAGLPVGHMLAKPMVVKIAGSSEIPRMRRSRAGRRELDWLQQWKIPLMLLNPEMIEQAVADGFSREQLIWMPNPVDVDTFHPARPDELPSETASWRSQHGIPELAPTVIYVGRLAPEKGLPELLRGFAAAFRSVPEAVLLLVGDGPQRAELEALSRDLDLPEPTVRFIGRVPPKEVPFWLRTSDIYALTSPNEGFSCALVEAMSAGLASVVSAIPANLQLIDEGIHGRTVAWNDPSAIGQALTELCVDSASRKRMGAAARARAVENYSTSQVVARYEELLGTLLTKDIVDQGKSNAYN